MISNLLIVSNLFAVTTDFSDLMDRKEPTFPAGTNTWQGSSRRQHSIQVQFHSSIRWAWKALSTPSRKIRWWLRHPGISMQSVHETGTWIKQWHTVFLSGKLRRHFSSTSQNRRQRLRCITFVSIAQEAETGVSRLAQDNLEFHKGRY